MSADAAEPSDECLIQQTLSGDDDAFAELARRHQPRLARMVWRFARNPEEAADLQQDIFLRAWRNLRQFRGDVPFEHWVSRLAIRQCYDLLRNRRRDREDTLAPEDWDRLREVATRPDDAAASRELLALAMRRLSPEERTVITLLEIEEQPIRTISTLTGWSEANVKVRAFRARAKLRTFLEELDESR